MILRLDADCLERHCSQAPAQLSPASAARSVRAFGWLAPWWLPQPVLNQAAAHQPAYRRYTHRPQLPSYPGGCWIIFTHPRELPSLRPAFVLPLCWRANAGDDPYLPDPLRTLADLVRGQVFGKEDQAWGLRLAVPASEEARDLSGLDGTAVGVESGWAALMGGLLLARGDGVPDGGIWASAAWDTEYGIGAICGLRDKLDLAAEWEAKLFVPAQNQRDVAQWRLGGNPMKVELLAPVSRSPDPARVLEPYLDQLGTEPQSNDSFDRRKAFYARVGRSRANKFYWDGLLETVIARCRDRVRAEQKDCRPKHLVTVVGNQPPVVALAPAVFEVERCLLLYEEPPDVKDTAERKEGEIERPRRSRCRNLPWCANRGPSAGVDATARAGLRARTHSPGSGRRRRPLRRRPTRPGGASRGRRSSRAHARGAPPQRRTATHRPQPPGWGHEGP